MTALNNRYLVGYQTEQDSRGQVAIRGAATIAGEFVEHQLTFFAQAHESCDVGRTDEGELIWISLSARDDSPTPALSLVPERITRFDPGEVEESLFDEPELSGNRRLVGAVKVMFSRRRKLVLNTAVAGIVFVFLGLGATFIIPQDSGALAEQADLSVASTQTREAKELSEPRDAAIEFVLSGQVPGLAIPEGASLETLHATIVSTSGEIVLVDVQSQQSDGLTTFATLLLQKSGTAWRIREVFDPR